MLTTAGCGAVMLDSTRARLTLWYTGVLALVLVISAAVTYTYLARAARGRTDQSLADTANSVASGFVTETDDENQTGDEAAVEAARAFHFDDRQALILDDSGGVVAATTPPASARGRRAWPPASALLLSAGELLEASAREGRAYATLPDRREGIRAYAASVKALGRSYTVVVAQSLHGEDEELEQARHAFFVGVPLALVCASLGDTSWRARASPPWPRWESAPRASPPRTSASACPSRTGGASWASSPRPSTNCSRASTSRSSSSAVSWPTPRTS
jgi:hypothetical protein